MNKFLKDNIYLSTMLSDLCINMKKYYMHIIFKKKYKDLQIKSIWVILKTCHKIEEDVAF